MTSFFVTFYGLGLCYAYLGGRQTERASDVKQVPSTVCVGISIKTQASWEGEAERLAYLG